MIQCFKFFNSVLVDVCILEGSQQLFLRIGPFSSKPNNQSRAGG